MTSARPSQAALVRALADSAPRPFWLDQAAAPAPTEPLPGDTTADLAVVGGGFSGLWTALLAKERDPGLDVVLVEAQRLAWAASGRNGGFCAASLTHGLLNGLSRFPEEMQTLERLGRENLDEIEATIGRHGIHCAFERTGDLTVATRPWQVAQLREFADAASRFGGRYRLLDGPAVRSEIDSPTYLAGVWDRDTCAVLDPARLAWGLRDACLRLGVRIHEQTPVRRIQRRDPHGLRLHTPYGFLDAPRVVLATGAQASLLRRLRNYVAPVYDYALVTEPLAADQLTSIGWSHRQGVTDAGNRFHYYRLTADDRILWGGYDAVYYAGGRITDARDQRPQTFTRLAEHFFATFPQLAGVRFTHRWGGVIDTCSRFCAFFGRAYGGRLAYATGYTGLGVGATRFGARVMLDLLAGEQTELTRLRMVRTRPMAFPPEPLRTAVIGLTRWSLARADEHGGRRNLWLRTLDRLGLGFDT
jgi:glycine/D-amino acid oxidase-like deaminating enzyme